MLNVDLNRLVLVCVATFIIQFIDTLSYSIRPSGVRTGKIAIALSLFNILALISRLSNMVQTPFLGSIVDIAIKEHQVSSLSIVFRLVIATATVATVLGIIFIPSFVRIFSKAIDRLDASGSVPRLIIDSMSIRRIKDLTQNIVRPRMDMIHNTKNANIPKGFLILNIPITAIYTVGMLSAIYAGALLPQFRLTASSLSGIINGMATILLAVVVDPTAAMVTDQALHGKRTLRDVNAMVIYLVGGKLLGTILGQIIFVPAAEFIAFIAKLIV